MPPITTPRARLVARWFGLRLSAFPEPARKLDPSILEKILPRHGQVVLIVGGSGSGKSSLLRALQSIPASGADWIDVDSAPLADRPLIDCLPPLDPIETLSRLSAVGLAEVWTWLRTPAQLSVGQAWRLKLALALLRCRQSLRPILVCDEFATVLDRITACVVARTFRKSIVAPLSALLATSHEDLASALRPDLVVRCDFGRIEIHYVSRE